MRFLIDVLTFLFLAGCCGSFLVIALVALDDMRDLLPHRIKQADVAPVDAISRT